MADRKKIKDTLLGKWLAEKAPNVLGTVGDLLPDSGALGVVKNLLDKEPGVDPAEAKAKIDAERALENDLEMNLEAKMNEFDKQTLDEEKRDADTSLQGRTTKQLGEELKDI